MLRPERDRLSEVAREILGALARDAVDQVERDIVEARLAERGHRAADIVGAGPTFERLEQVALKALRSERDPVDTVFAKHLGQSRRHRLRICLDGRLRGTRKGGEKPGERRGLRERGRAAAEEDRVDLVREHVALELQLGEQRVDVAAVLAVVARDCDEVAVAAAVRAERQVDVEVGSARSRPRDGGRSAPFWNDKRQLVTRG